MAAACGYDSPHRRSRPPRPSLSRPFRPDNLDAKSFLKRINAKRCIAKDQRIFRRKAFLGQAETPPFQESTRMKNAEIWKGGASTRGEFAGRSRRCHSSGVTQSRAPYTMGMRPTARAARVMFGKDPG